MGRPSRHVDSIVMLREDLDAIPAYVPGAHLPEAVALSSNESPLPPLPAVRDAIAGLAGAANRYPDMGAADLKAALGRHLDLPAARVAVGCGSSALLHQLIQATCRPGDEVVFAWRSFEAYPILARAVGARPVEVPLDGEHRHDLPAMADAIGEDTSLVIVCNPNNPTGTTISAHEFEDFLARVPESVTVALDEAYAEFDLSDASPSARRLIDSHPNLVGLRTFSKAYGLAGLRVGYAFGSEEIVAALDKVAIPFGVNALAQAAAPMALAEQDELRDRVSLIAAERERLAAELGAVASQANFVWLPASDLAPLEPAEIAERLAGRGVLVRAFPEGVRVTVGTREENDALLSALRAVRDGA